MTKQRPLIACVDDDLALLAGLRRRLARRRPDWAFAYFESAEAALAADEDIPFDVVVTDMMMPGLSGLEFAERIRARREVPCIILTGSPDLSSALEAINQANAFRYYTKPCDDAVLEEGVAAALAEASGAGASAPDALALKISVAALDRLALCVLVVDARGKLVFSNQNAVALVAAGDGLTVSADDICRASAPEDRKKLAELITAAARLDDETLEDTLATAVSRSSGKRPLCVFATHLSSYGSDSGAEPLVALFISDPETRPVPTADVISRLHGLTPSEAKLAYPLARGLRLEDAAMEAGVTISTARTYLKNIFSKTATSRQSELLKLILASPAVI